MIIEVEQLAYYSQLSITRFCRDHQIEVQNTTAAIQGTMELAMKTNFYDGSDKILLKNIGNSKIIYQLIMYDSS